MCALGRLNWLADPSQTPHLPTARLATLFGVKQTTMSTKAKSVLDLLGLDHFGTDFCLPSRLVSHPTAWLVMIDGLIYDARTLPVDLQTVLARQGVIPGVVVPADTGKPTRTTEVSP